jgi:hypothetical protein
LKVFVLFLYVSMANAGLMHPIEFKYLSDCTSAGERFKLAIKTAYPSHNVVYSCVQR